MPSPRPSSPHAAPAFPERRVAHDVEEELMTHTYNAEVTRDGKWWMVAIPELDGLTQAQSSPRPNSWPANTSLSPSDFASTTWH